MVSRSRNIHGLTMMEILIAIVLTSFVFAGGMSMYTSSLKFLKTRQNTDLTLSPDIAFEPVARKIALANFANLTHGGSQLNIQLDQACNGTPLATPSNTGDDSWWHYRFVTTNLMSFCENSNTNPTLTAPGNPAGTVSVLDTLSNNASTWAALNPSAAGTPTVIGVQLRSPTVNVDTEIKLGAATKR